MKTRVEVVLCVLLASMNASAEVLVSQVYPNPVGTESGGEALEIWNAGSLPVNLSGWTVRSEASAADATLPAILLAPNARVLIADAGWNASKDNASWPAAAHEEALTLSNTDGGLALVDAGGRIADAVGWGDASGIADGLLEGTPAPNPQEGQALVRSADTDNNAADFLLGPFAPAGARPDQALATREIAIHLTVEGGLPAIVDVSVADDDPLRPGIQVVPVPGDVAAVVVFAVIEDPNGVADVADVRFTLNGQETSLALAEALGPTRARFEGAAALRFYDPPGNYSGLVSVMDAGGQQAFASVDLEYLSALALGVADALVFAAAPGETQVVQAALQNLGNVPFSLDAAATPLSGTANIDPSALSIGLNATALVPLTSRQQILAYMPVGAAVFEDLLVGVTVPLGTPLGDYAGALQLYATPQ